MMVGNVVGLTCFFDRFAFNQFNDGYIVNVNEVHTKCYRIYGDTISTTLYDIGESCLMCTVQRLGLYRECLVESTECVLLNVFSFTPCSWSGRV